MQEIKGIFFRDFGQSYIPQILKEMYIEKIYRPYLEGKKDLVIIDGGGNVGLFTHYAYDFAKKIYTVEPSAEHVEVINHMLKYNKMDDKVTVIQKALSLDNGTTSFYHNENTTSYSLKSVVDDHKDKPEIVDTIRMDTLFTQYGIDNVDFMKMDIEGSECEVLSGEGFAKVADKIKAMVIEYHTWSGVNPQQVFNVLSDLGFKTRTIPGDASLIGATRD